MNIYIYLDGGMNSAVQSRYYSVLVLVSLFASWLVIISDYTTQEYTPSCLYLIHDIYRAQYDTYNLLLCEYAAVGSDGIRQE